MRWQAHRREDLGPFIVIVGPDGVGKTSVARALANSYAGPTAYIHFRPPLRGSLPRQPPPPETAQPPKSRGQGSRASGWLRLLRSVMIFTIGFWTTVRPHQRRRTLVIGDRWLYGYVAQPWALRYYGPHWLARAAISAVPRPDLVASLTAPPDIVRVRKPELSHEEIQQELDAWADLPRAPLLSFSTEMDPSSVAAAILASIGASPAASPPSDSLS